MGSNNGDETISNGKESTDSETYPPEYRDRLRTWLVKMIHSGTIPGLVWENDEKTIFRMPWKHAGRQDYNLEEDSKIFMAWAKHSGRYREGIDKPEPIVWKTRLRCALNKMPDIRELPDRSRLDISEPYRVYQLLPPVHKASQIRRRLYKRSQSHDTDNMTSPNHVSPSSSYMSSIDNNEGWTKPFAFRRNNSSESFSTSPPQRPGHLIGSTSSQLNSPAFWLSQAGGLPFKAPISNPLLPLQQSSSDVLPLDHSALNPISSRYPLLPGLHTSFAPTVPGVFSASQGLSGLRNPFGFTNPAMIGSLKHMTAQAFANDQKYHEQLSFHRNMESVNGKTRSDDQSQYPSVHGKLEKLASEYNADELIKNPALLECKAKELEERLRNLHTLMGRDVSDNKVSECNRLYEKLDESQHRIETLECELSHYRSAHAREKEARERLEIERERMKNVLEHMGEGLRSLAVHMHPADSANNDDVQRIDQEFSLERKRTLNEITKQLAITGLNTANLIREATSPSLSFPSHSPQPSDNSHDASDRGSPLQVRTSSHRKYNKSTSCDESQASEGLKRKRMAGPLDLTVGSPSKIQRTSGDESELESHSHYPGQSKSSPPSLLYDNSYRSHLSPEESSASSVSPDHVIRSGSLSPPQRSPHIQNLHHSHPGTIQVS